MKLKRNACAWLKLENSTTVFAVRIKSPPMICSQVPHHTMLDMLAELLYLQQSATRGAAEHPCTTATPMAGV
jgi:hypothetical protein